MYRLFLSLIALSTLHAQIVVDTVAGGKVRSGVPAQDIALGFVVAMTWGADGNLVFTESAQDLIHRVRQDGIIETIAGTGVSGYTGDGGPVTSALLHGPGESVFEISASQFIQ